MSNTSSETTSTEATQSFAFAAPPPGIAADAKPRCLKCGYPLIGLAHPQCPECGTPFEPSDGSTFTWKPPVLRWRLWGPGLLLAFLLGLVQSGLLIYAGSFGWALGLAVPLVAGTILGYGVRARWFVLALCALILLSGLVFGLMSASLAGIYCGVMLAGMFLGPILLGTVFGAILRVILKGTRFSQRTHLPMLALAVLGLGPIIAGLAEERWTSPMTVRSVQTQGIINAPPRHVWRALRFYGDIKAKPPWLAQVGLPTPKRVEGKLAGVGDQRRCVYAKGYLVKKVTAWRPHRYLGFDVVTQHKVESRSAELKGGAFQLTPIAGGWKTRLSLTTEYRPLLQARVLWRPLENYTVHALHHHVIRAVRRHSDEPMPTGPIARQPRE